MAFSNTRRVMLGGGLSFYVADFTNTVGAADQTLALDGRVLFAKFNSNTSSEPVDFSGSQFSTSLSGGITTVTVYSESGITSGTFVALIDNGGS